MSSFRGRVLGLAEVGLRVPPLFLVDEILKIGLGGLLEAPTGDLVLPLDGGGGGNATAMTFDPRVYYGVVVVSAARLLAGTLGCLVSMGMFLLSTKHLMVVYMYLVSVALVLLSYWHNAEQTSLSTSPSSFFASLSLSALRDHLFQLLLGVTFANVHLGPRPPPLQSALPAFFLLPGFLRRHAPLPDEILAAAPLAGALPPLLLSLAALLGAAAPVFRSAYGGYAHAKNFVTNFGMSALVEAEWLRLNVPEVLRAFWTVRAGVHAVIYIAAPPATLTGEWEWYDLAKHLMVTGCDTLTAVLGITSVVSYSCHYVGKFFQWILLMDDDNDKNFGTVSAIVFYILALQTGLTGLEPDVRFVRLCRNFCLLFTALLHFTHNVVGPLLMSLSASHHPAVRRHLHALAVALVLILLPAALVYFLWRSQHISTWLLAVTAFSVEVVVKVLVTLAVYALFLWDARRDAFWERLDDYIYYIRAFGNTVEFCFGIFLFFNGAWILAFESGSAIRAAMMCIHAYFNIWCDARTGWAVFMKRRTAVNKIESLPEAGGEELRLLDDVCAICYQEMSTAKITRCRHFFHGVCLRKWLYVQDRCPLCHEILHGGEGGEVAAAPAPAQEEVEER